MAIGFKGSHFEREIILWGVRWYVAYPISYRQLELLDARGLATTFIDGRIWSRASASG